MKLFYKIIIIFGTTIFSAFFLIAISLTLYLTYRIPFNNYYLKTFQNNFRQSIKSFHPAQSSLIAEMAETGNFGESNHCDFLAGEFRASPFSKEVLQKIYPDDFLTAGVYFIDDDIFMDYPYNEWKEKYLRDYKPKENENVYLVWVADEDNSPDGDIRCH